jgi:amylosucrase
MVFGFGGIPLLYMGDEIGMFNDPSYRDDPAKAADNRWIHRPKMDWDNALRAEQGIDPLSVSTQIRSRIQRLIDVRRSLPALHASVATKVRAGRGAGVAIFDRRHPAGDLVQVYNLSDSKRWVGSDELGLSGSVTELLGGQSMELGEGLSLAPYSSHWLVRSPS